MVALTSENVILLCTQQYFECPSTGRAHRAGRAGLELKAWHLIVHVAQWRSCGHDRLRMQREA